MKQGIVFLDPCKRFKENIPSLLYRTCIYNPSVSRASPMDEY